jgi:hypothetical protein
MNPTAYETAQIHDDLNQAYSFFIDFRYNVPLFEGKVVQHL